MMNAELVNARQTRIIIPTVYREDYLGATRQLTRQGLPDAYIRMLQRAQKFSATMVSDDITVMQTLLEQSNAFLEPEQAKLKIIEKPREPIAENLLQLREPDSDETEHQRKTGPKR